MPASGIRDGSRHKSEMSCLVSSRGWEPGPAELAEAAAAVQLVALVRQELRSRPAGATLQVDSLYDSDSKQSSTTFEKLWFFGRRINVTTLKNRVFLEPGHCRMLLCVTVGVQLISRRPAGAHHTGHCQVLPDGIWREERPRLASGCAATQGS